jgi:UDP-2,3-diacylglucosamine pyrophosphatase LpxH
MQTYIISDLHLGVKQSRIAVFVSFLDSLPSGARLVLNGDIISHYYTDQNLDPEHTAVMDRLRQESYEREIVWVRGNHERRLELQEPGNINFVESYAIGKRIYIAHGHRFDWLMPTTRALLIPTRFLYDAVARCFGSRMHVAEFAKRFSGIYSVLCRHVAGNAARYARRHGFEAVTCGHTHYAEDREVGGIRYLNTGCWTESSTAIVVVDADDIQWRVLATQGEGPQ